MIAALDGPGYSSEFQGIAPAGKRIILSGATVHHMANGRIAETWLTVDNLDLLRQLGRGSTAEPAAFPAVSTPFLKFGGLPSETSSLPLP